MPKRKRSPPSPDEAASHALSRQKKLCSQRISSAQKSLISALRLGATFERQKHSRRRKAAEASNDKKGVGRLDEEYAILKRLDLNKAAEQYLRRTIARVKSIKDHEALPKSIQEIENSENHPAILNVKARLYKVEGVRKAVDGAIEDLKEILLASNQSQALEGSRKEKISADKKAGTLHEQEDGKEEALKGPSSEDLVDENDGFSAFNMRIAAPSSAEEDSDDPLSEENRPPSVENSDREYAELETESSAEFTDDSDAAVPREGYILTSDHDASDASSASSDIGGSDKEQPKRLKTEAKPPSQKASKSTFLPTLSHAAFYSGSESEASDIEDLVAPKKNRRGQRERQKIWELKYGEEAKHLKQGKNAGWDPKRGAIDTNRNARGGRGGGRATRGGLRNSRASERGEKDTGPKKVTKKEDTGPLHPSWQAAKAAKEKKVDMKPLGQKIVFD